MTQSYKDLFEVNLKYLDYVISKTLTVHQYLHNVSGSGSSVEAEVRSLLSRLVPSRFRITHGTLSRPLVETSNLPFHLRLML